MKKVFALFLCVLLIFTMTACGNSSRQTETTQEPAPSDEVVFDNTDLTMPSENIEPKDTETSSVPDSTVTDDIIRENGNLPDDEDELTDAELNYYVGLVMHAIIDLDTETMDIYADNESAAVIKAVKNDDNYRWAWENTIGKSIYFDDCGVIVYKDPQYAFANWITTVYNENGELKSEIADYSFEEMKEIFETYGADTPYVATQIDSFDIENYVDIDIDEGKITIDCEEILELMGWDDLSNMCPAYAYYIYDDSDNNERMSRILFGQVSDGISLGLDYISDDGKYTLWKDLITNDLSTIIAAYDSATGYDLNVDIDNNTNIWAIIYQMYYKNADIVPKIESWMANNVRILRDMSSVAVYIPAETEQTYPYHLLTDAEKEKLADIEIYIKCNVFRGEANTIHEFNPFATIIEQMIYLGELEKLY